MESLVNAFRHAFPGRPRHPRDPVSIVLHGQTLQFSGLADFAFCLASRTAVPAWRTDTLLRRPLDELRTEACTVRTLENQIGGILEDGEINDLSCIRTLKPLGTRMFSKDNDWRGIFDQLIGAGRGKEAHVRMALSKYLQYLGARRHVLELVTALRQDAGRRTEAVTGDAAFAPDKATVMFDASAHPADLDDPGALRRLPHGEAVRLRLSGGRHLDIRLAGHPFSLSRGPEWCLSDACGHRYPLHPGVNAIGRSRDNDIAVDPGLHDVSRRHLLAQPLGAEEIELVDLSTAGTFIESESAA